MEKVLSLSYTYDAIARPAQHAGRGLAAEIGNRLAAIGPSSVAVHTIQRRCDFVNDRVPSGPDVANSARSRYKNSVRHTNFREAAWNVFCFCSGTAKPIGTARGDCRGIPTRRSTPPVSPKRKR